MKGQRAITTPGPSSSANITKVEQQLGARAEDDVIFTSEEVECGLLLLPPQLQELVIHGCPELSIVCSSPHDDSTEQDGRTRGGGGFQGLTSLRRLEIRDCPKFLSSYSSSSFSSSFPFPDSLEHLYIWGAVGMDTLLPLSNLTSLTSLELSYCWRLRGEGLLSLLTRGHLTKLMIKQTPNFFVDSEPPWVHEQVLPSSSSKLQELVIHDVAGFTAAPIRRSLHFSLLTKLEITDDKVKCFTDQQEAILSVNSLEQITFSSYSIQSLPERIHTLPNLKRLYFWHCKSIQMLPNHGLPSSLEELDISHCPEMQSLPKYCLPNSLQKLVISSCPAIRSLPKVDDLPTPLRELDVSLSHNAMLRSQCRSFINIIPIVKVDPW